MKCVALFLPNWIGDVVMATPAIRAVREHFRNRYLIAVCKPYVSSVLDGSPWFDEVILHDKRGPRERRSWNVIRRLRTQAIDTAILFPNSFRAALIAALAGCKRTGWLCPLLPKYVVDRSSLPQARTSKHLQTHPHDR